MVSHIYFCRARRAQGLPDSAMPYTAPLGMWGSVGALAFCIIICLTKNFEVFCEGRWSTATFVTGYLGIPVYLALIAGYKIWYRNPGVKPLEADFYTGKDKIDKEEQEFIAAKAAKAPNRGGWFYRTFISWLF